MADMADVNSYQNYMGQMQDVTQQQHANTYQEYMAPAQSTQNSAVNRDSKSDSEKKDQSRYSNTSSGMDAED